MLARKTVTKMVTKTPPCLRLKALREQAGITAREMARLCGMKAESTWFRYEEIGRMGTKPIPMRIVSKAAPHLVGRGSPKVTYDDLIAISDAGQLTGKVALLVPPRPIQPSVEVPAYEHVVDATIGKMVIRYRAENGVYMSRKMTMERSFGTADLCPAADVRADQFCAVVADDHAEPVYKQGTCLHCAAMSAYTTGQLVGRRVLVLVAQGDLVQVVVGRVAQANGNGVELRALDDGRELNGDVLGVIIGKYERE